MFVRARRAGLAAVTLPGEDIKPERLLQLAEGDVLKVRKGRWLIWSDAALGGLKEQIRRYYADRPDVGWADAVAITRILSMMPLPFGRGVD